MCGIMGSFRRFSALKAQPKAPPVSGGQDSQEVASACGSAWTGVEAWGWTTEVSSVSCRFSKPAISFSYTFGLGRAAARRKARQKATERETQEVNSTIAMRGNTADIVPGHPMGERS